MLGGFKVRRFFKMNCSGLAGTSYFAASARKVFMPIGTLYLLQNTGILWELTPIFLDFQMRA